MYTPTRKIDLSMLSSHYIAHRGYYNNSSDYPENSMEAFKLALLNDFGIEFDLQLTSDNQIVIFHDDDMERMTGVKGRICDHTYKDLQNYNLSTSEAKIPLFSDLLKLVDGKVPLVIEIKTCKDTNKKLVDLLVPMLKEYKGQFCVYSFDPFVMRLFRKAYPEALRGMLNMYYDEKSLKGKFRRWFMNHLLSLYIAKPDFISAECHYRPKKYDVFKKKAPIICWTIRSKEEEIEAMKYFTNVVFENYNPKEK